MHNEKNAVTEKAQAKVPHGFEAAKCLLGWHTGGREVSEGGLVWDSRCHGYPCHPQQWVNDLPSLALLS